MSHRNNGRDFLAIWSIKQDDDRNLENLNVVQAINQHSIMN